MECVALSYDMIYLQQWVCHGWKLRVVLAETDDGAYRVVQLGSW